MPHEHPFTVEKIPYLTLRKWPIPSLTLKNFRSLFDTYIMFRSLINIALLVSTVNHPIQADGYVQKKKKRCVLVAILAQPVQADEWCTLGV